MPANDTGKISGIVTVQGVGAVRNVVALSYNPFPIEGSDDGQGSPIQERQIISSGVSAIDGSYSLDLGEFTDEVIVIALDQYGERWRPSNTYSVDAIIRPTPGNETGYVYRCTVPGVSDLTEPLWWINNDGDNLGDVGTATFEAIESWWPTAHAPIVPEIIAGSGVLLDEFFNDITFLTHAEPAPGDTVLDPFFDDVIIILAGDPSLAADPQDFIDEGPRRHLIDHFSNVAMDAITKPPGDFAGSIAFDGSGDEIKTVSNSSNWGFHFDNMTVDFWIKLRPDSDLNYVITNRDGSATTNRWVIEMSTSNKPDFWCRNSSGKQNGLTCTQALVDDTWHFVALVMVGNVVTWFVDGIKYNSATLNYKPSSVSDKLQIGASAPDPAWDLNGYLAQVRITQAARYTADFAVPTAPAPQKKSIYFDSIENVVANSMSWDFRMYAQVVDDALEAKFGDGAISVIDSFMDIDSDTVDQLLYFGTADYTVEFYIKFVLLPNGQVILTTAFNGVANGIKIQHVSGNVLEISIGGIPRFNTAVVTVGDWHHFAFSRKGGTTRFFLNGTKQGTDVTDPSNLLLQKLRIGANSADGERIDALVDEIRITKAGRYDVDFTVPALPFPDTKYGPE